MSHGSATQSIGFIGGGNMATAMIKGIIKKDLYQPSEIFVYDLDLNKSESLHRETGIRTAKSNIDIIQSCKLIVLAVKPDVLSTVLEEIKPFLSNEHILVSIAAGISTQFIKQKIDNRCSVVRTMPNTPALVGEGMTALCKDQHNLDGSQWSKIREIFSALGKVEEVDEKLIDAVTALSGSSPAYVYLFIEAMADGAVLMGMSREQAYRIAAQAVLGAAKMVLESGKHPGFLKDMVCSPGGTTIEAIYSLEKSGFRGSVMEAMKICAEKSKRMGEK